MLLSVNPLTGYTERRRTEHLHAFGLDERQLQSILFRTLDRLFPDDEPLLLMQSRHWQEEPDLMALDKDGKLYIFELKAVSSHPSNLLQVLRYGQKFGNFGYDELDRLFQKFNDTGQSLKQAHQARFESSLEEQDFNKKQVFVTITNGLDYQTREALRYWRSSGLEMRPWVYRVYRGEGDEMLLEISAFRVEDNPYEDLAEGYYILNTNINNNEMDHQDMVTHGKAAAYFDPWKYKIERLQRGDVVFLYQSGVGIVGVGEASGELRKDRYHDDPDSEDEQYYMYLRNYSRVEPPMSAAEIKATTGINHVFMSTMFGLSEEAGKELRQRLHADGRLATVEQI